MMAALRACALTALLTLSARPQVANAAGGAEPGPEDASLLIKAHYNYTLDCSSFTSKIPHNSPGHGLPGKEMGTCSMYGDTAKWNKIIHRPLPGWYNDMKFGVFIHWGPYSVPSYGSEWFWHNYQCTGPGDPGQKGKPNTASVRAFADKNFPGVKSDYPEYADMFHAELYDAADWVTAIKGSGAQYVLPVAKHHDGFCMWDARDTAPDWNAAQVGPQRDVLTELYNASVAAGLPFGIYYSQGEWFDSNFVSDAKSNFTATSFVESKLVPQRLDLVHRFNKAILWHTDGGWMAPDQYWNNLDWLTYLYEESPLKTKVVSCNSMGVGCCSSAANDKTSVTPEQSEKCWELGDAPSGGDRTTAGSVTGHFYTNQMTIQRGSWSWDRKEDKMTDFFSATELLWTLISTTAWNGTLVMNIGPASDGRIPPIFLDRFQEIGDWLSVNGEAIYGSRVWRAALPTGSEGDLPGGFEGSGNATYYTAGTVNSGCQHAQNEGYGAGNCKTVDATGVVYAVFMHYPEQDDATHNRTLSLTTPVGVGGTTKVELLGSTGELAWEPTPAGGISVELPAPPFGSRHAWTLKLTGLKNA